ncbi:ATP-binding protein [Aquabacter spiritensis]|uniref:histidine kinase n=1 Tax=Aquabacter spiritensis TaxID=933073 RepID=A0A4R3LTR0_9HYPH|nr:ATP-binding protein [Aquabacter spiritensis]TCT03933.1 PAS domain S-box-containing protein [Aquabacter spiritensis]
MGKDGEKLPAERRGRQRGIGRVLVIAVLGAGISAAIVLAVGFASFREFASANRLREDLIYSSAIRDHLQRIFEDLLSAESGTLGYVVTGRREFLDPLERADGTLAGDIVALTQLAAARPAHKVSLAEFARFTEEEMRLLREMVATRDARGALAAANVMEARRGKSLMDRIRLVVTDISNAEIAASEQRTYEVRLASQRTKQTLLLLLSAAIAVVAGSSLVMIAHLLGRRRAEIELAETLARHRAILASAMDAIVTVNERGLIETANPATTRMFGWSREELAGAPIGQLFTLDGEDADRRLLRQLETYALDGGHARELTGRRKDGSAVPVDVAVGEMQARDGTQLVAMLHDITERKRAEVIKNEFVSTVSHELRTPLTSIAGSLGLLDGGAAGALPAGAKRLVAIAHQNSRRLVRLINDILDIEKMQSASVAFAHDPVSLEEVARLAIEQNAAFADQHGVRLVLQAVSCDSTVVGDHDRLIQVLTNLISNAVKFSPAEGTVSLRVGRRTGMVRVSVEDHGTGIPLAFRASMFTRFAQADNSDTRQRGGTGLGLAIVKEIVDRHGGRISFETEEGVGTTFHVDLPARLDDAAPPDRLRDAPVLVVDSDPAQATGLLDLFAARGIAAEGAATAAECEGRAALHPLRAIVISPLLHDRDGLSLIRALRRAERTRTTPLILVDGGGRARDGGIAALAVADWLDQPPEPARLVALLARFAPRARRPAVLHIAVAGETRRAFARAAKGIADVIPATSLDEARAALALRPCSLLVVDIDDPGLAREELIRILEQPEGLLPPFVGCSRADGDPAVARRLAELISAAGRPLPPLAAPSHGDPA